MTAGGFFAKRSAIEIARALQSDPHAPVSAMIEVADRCNETCVHCYQVQGQKGELSTEAWFQIIDELAEMGVLFLTISGGEATLRRDFIELVAHARDRGFAVKIYTNGLRITPALADKLAELAVQEVQISLYSTRAEAHDAVTRVPGSFERTVTAVRELRRAGVAVVVKSPLIRGTNETDIEAYAAFVTGLGADFAMDPFLDPREDGDRSPEALRISDEDYVGALTHPTLKPGGIPEPPAKALDDSLCAACSGGVHIEANGEMRPCTQLTVPVGQALDGVRRAWETNEHGRSIRAVTWRDLPGCRQCDLRDYCSRCFAVAKVEVQDALAPYETACHLAKLTWQAVHGTAPSVDAAARDDLQLGPYRRVDEGRFETVAIEPMAEDDERRHRNAWARPSTPLIRLRTGRDGGLASSRGRERID